MFIKFQHITLFQSMDSVLNDIPKRFISSQGVVDAITAVRLLSSSDTSTNSKRVLRIQFV